MPGLWRAHHGIGSQGFEDLLEVCIAAMATSYHDLKPEENEAVKVYIVPIADKEFIPISETNKVRYYLENESGNLINPNMSWESYARAAMAAKSLGYEIN